MNHFSFSVKCVDLILNLSKLLCKNSVKNKDKSFWKWQEIIYASYVFEKEKTC